MRTAKEWIEWHEANPAVSDEELNKRIQADALRRAANFCHMASPNAPHSYIADELLAAATELES